MAMFPDPQRRAREELDSVVGGNRLPDFSDRESLPYLDALLLETLRWNPMVPLGTQT
jgi:cytochrome P450